MIEEHNRLDAKSAKRSCKISPEFFRISKANRNSRMPLAEG